MNWDELYKKYNSKIKQKSLLKNSIKILIASFIIVAITSLLIIQLSYPTFVSIKYDLMDEEVVFEPLEGNNCELYITLPNKETIFYTDYKCEEFVLSKEDILDFSKNQKGEYKFIVFSDSGSRIFKNLRVEDS